MKPSPEAQGLAAAFLTPLFLGLAPIFGKLAINGGAEPFAVAAIRTVIAAGLLWGFYAIFMRKAIYIYPAGLLGCMIVGAVNGIGSLFYYSGLGLIDASMVQLLNGLYIVFAVLLSRIGGERLDARIWLRVALALLALLMITSLGAQQINWLGVGLMLGSALMFAGTLILGQYVLFEMPSTTVSLYVLTTMAVVVLMVWAAVGEPLPAATLEAAFPPILILGVTTALSRLTMFASVQWFGSLRTAITAVAEIAVALTLAYIFLGDRLTPLQGVGVMVLLTSLLLIRSTDMLPRGFNPNMLLVQDMSSIQFQRIAYHRAFGKAEHDNEYGVMGAVTTAEMQAIRQMMGAKDSPVDPLPLPARNGRSVDLEAFLNDAPPASSADVRATDNHRSRSADDSTDEAPKDHANGHGGGSSAQDPRAQG
ncbi:MAG: DMT family transporter [Chloroflexi bacterium]|nr:DMT family transporter [Chloroflexota bacterium]